MVAGKRRAPVIQHAQESAFPDVRYKFIFREERNAQPLKRRKNDMGRAVENKLTIDANIQPTAPALGTFPIS